MPVVNCPIDNYTYATPDSDAVIAAALLTTHAITHTPTNQQRVNVAKTQKVKRPSISSAGTSQDWKYFETRWADYKQATNITGSEVIVQLLECCEEQLRRDLTRSVGSTLIQKTEDEILTAMKLLAVREENIMVARATLSSMHQDMKNPYVLLVHAFVDKPMCANIQSIALVATRTFLIHFLYLY